MGTERRRTSAARFNPRPSPTRPLVAGAPILGRAGGSIRSRTRAATTHNAEVCSGGRSAPRSEVGEGHAAILDRWGEWQIEQRRAATWMYYLTRGAPGSHRNPRDDGEGILPFALASPLARPECAGVERPNRFCGLCGLVRHAMTNRGLLCAAHSLLRNEGMHAYKMDNSEDAWCGHEMLQTIEAHAVHSASLENGCSTRRVRQPARREGNLGHGHLLGAEE